jgi:hypothetical protein
MSVIKTIIQSVLSSVLSSVLKIVSLVELAVTEVFIKLSATAGSFHKLGADWVATGDYSIEQYVYYVGELIRLSGNINNGGSRVFLTSGYVFWAADASGTGVQSANDVVPVNKFSLIKVQRIGSLGKIFVNGTLVLTATVPTGSATINTFGNQNGVVSGGLLSKLKLTDLTDTSNTLDFKLNKLTGNFELPVNNVFGSEEVTNGDFANYDGWTITAPGTESVVITNNTLILDRPADGEDPFVINTGSVVAGNIYEVVFEVVSATKLGSNIGVRFGSHTTFLSPSISSLGIKRQFILATQTGLIGIQHGGGGPSTIVLRDFTVKSVTNFITYQNIPESARHEYTLNDGFYSGIQRVINGDFATGDLTGFDETKAGQLTTVNDGSVVIDLNGLPDGGIRQSDIILPIGTMFTFGFDLTILEDFSNDNFFSLSAVGFDQNEVLESGRQFFTFISDQENGNITIRAARGNNRTGSYSLENIFLKERIEIAFIHLRDVMIKLSSTAGSFYKLDTDWVAYGDYSIEQYVYFIGDFIQLTGNVNNLYSRVGIQADGRVFWFPDSSGASISFPTGAVPLNKLSLIKVERIGTVGKIYVNGSLLLTATVPTGTLTVNANGNSGGNISGGLLSKLKLTDLTDADNTLEFKLNKLTGNYELPVGNVFGIQKVINGDFATGITGWSSHNNASIAFSSNRIQVQSDGSQVGNCYQTIATVVGQSYEFSCILEGVAGSGAVLAVGTTPGGNGDIAAIIIGEDTIESVSSVFTAIATTTYIRVGLRSVQANQSIYGSDISVKEVTNFITYQNIPEYTRDTYTLTGNAYLSSEKVINGNFADGLNNWVTSSGSPTLETGGDFGSNYISLSGTDVVRQSVGVFNVVVGATYEYTSLHRGNGGSIAVGGGNNQDLPNNTGIPSELKMDFVASQNNGLYLVSRSGLFFELDNQSVREKIEVAS